MSCSSYASLKLVETDTTRTLGSLAKSLQLRHIHELSTNLIYHVLVYRQHEATKRPPHSSAPLPGLRHATGNSKRATSLTRLGDANHQIQASTRIEDDDRWAKAATPETEYKGRLSDR